MPEFFYSFLSWDIIIAFPLCLNIPFLRRSFFHHETDIYTNRNKTGEELKECIVIWEENKSILCEKKYENKNGRKQQYTF